MSNGDPIVSDPMLEDYRAYVQWLDYQNVLPTFQAMHRTLAELLSVQPGFQVLDVGCGTGDAARMLAEQVGPTGRVVGLDISTFMLDEARRRSAGQTLPVEFSEGDIEQLPFADHTFDRCRCEVVLQHVANPRDAIKELVRVTRPGGRVVVADTDWPTALASDPVTQALMHVSAGMIPNPQIGREVARLFRESGLQDITIRPFMVGIIGQEWSTDAIETFQTILDRSIVAGVIGEEAATNWRATFERDICDGIAFILTAYVVVAGTKPA